MRNFGGQPSELWYPGGEKAFARSLVKESHQLPSSSFWFTALISQSQTLPGIYKELQWAEAVEVKTIDMAQDRRKAASWPGRSSRPSSRPPAAPRAE